MKNIVTLTVFILLSLVAYSQDEEPKSYDIEIWDAEVYSKNDFSYIELSLYNAGDAFDEPVIQILHDDIFIANTEKEVEDAPMLSKSLHKYEIPVEIPSNYSGKKIKIEILVTFGKEFVSKNKIKAKINY